MKIITVILNLEGTWYDLKKKQKNNNIEKDYFHSIVSVKSHMHVLQLFT